MFWKFSKLHKPLQYTQQNLRNGFVIGEDLVARQKTIYIPKFQLLV